jgi:hypothetical protein
MEPGERCGGGGSNETAAFELAEAASELDEAARQKILERSAALLSAHRLTSDRIATAVTRRNADG